MENAKLDSYKEKLLGSLTALRNEGASSEEILSLVQDCLNVQLKPEPKIPVSIFKNSKLGSLENIVKYMRENLLLTFKQIGEFTNRNPVALSVTYRNAKKKFGKAFAEEISPYSIPPSILKEENSAFLKIFHSI